MIVNVLRTTIQLGEYISRTSYGRARVLAYVVISVIIGMIASNSNKASDLPIITVVAILFGFTINAVVMFGNSFDDYTSDGGDHQEQLENYYKKAVAASVHTLGIGLITIVLSSVFKLYPDMEIILYSFDILDSSFDIEIMSLLVYIFLSYYILFFSVVITAAAELVTIRTD
jgi:hypothetical protein